MGIRTSIALMALALLAVPAQAALQLEVDLSDRVIRAYDGSNVVAEYGVAVGKEKNPTPQGSFKIRKVVWNPTWVPPDEKWAKGKDPKGPWDKDNPMKRVKMFFKEPDYYIHGTGDEDSIGDAASHGCIRMTPSDVTELAKVVMTHGGKPMPEPWYKRILHSRATKVVYLSEPVPIRIVN